MTSGVMSPQLTERKLRVARAWFAFTFVFFAAFMGIALFLALTHSGVGFGDGRLVQSCYTPGGPYFVKGTPVASQPCPNNHTAQVNRGRR